MENRKLHSLGPPTHLFLTSQSVTFKPVTPLKPVSLSEKCQDADTDLFFFVIQPISAEAEFDVVCIQVQISAPNITTGI